MVMEYVYGIHYGFLLLYTILFLWQIFRLKNDDNYFKSGNHIACFSGNIPSFAYFSANPI